MVRQKAKGYRATIEWIALNDDPASGDEVDVIEGYISVQLTGYIFGKDPLQVAKEVFRHRERSGALDREEYVGEA